MVKKDCQVLVVGGGIAGVAITEIFSRSGHKTILIEDKDKLCIEASGSHHGWFHFGSLYSIFPSNQFMRTLIGGIEDLIDYYGSFRGMNLSLTEKGKLGLKDSEKSWIRDEPIDYLVAARNNEDFHLLKSNNIFTFFKKLVFRLTWEFAIKQFISRHHRYQNYNWNHRRASAEIPKAGWMDYSKKFIKKPDDNDFNFNKDSHFLIEGFDRPMNPINIIGDLVKSILFSGAKIYLNCGYRSHKKFKENKYEVLTNKYIIRTEKIIFASGKNLGSHTMNKNNISVVASPLLVVYPAISNKHIVRLTPFVDKTINHIFHEINGIKYSVIGGGYASPVDDKNKTIECCTKLEEIARQFFKGINNDSFLETYVGYKTELVASQGERNYQYIIKNIDEGIYSVLPGKFTLCFSTAVNCYRTVFGKEPKKDFEYDTTIDVQQYVSIMQHAKIVLSSLKK